LSVQGLRDGGDQGTRHRTRDGGAGLVETGENGPVQTTPGGLSVDEIVAVLASGADRSLSPNVPVSQLDHALQTAALLARDHPEDPGLAAAGLVHDIGHLLPGGSDERHAVDGGAAVRDALGARVAGIVALHVEAKRYLVASEGEYGRRLARDSVDSLGRQGGVLSAEGSRAFLARRWAGDAVALRRADDTAKVDGLVVEGLGRWVPLLRGLSG
jgi:predicted HD phosphohydrolase